MRKKVLCTLLAVALIFHTAGAWGYASEVTGETIGSTEGQDGNAGQTGDTQGTGQTDEAQSSGKTADTQGSGQTDGTQGSGQSSGTQSGGQTDGTQGSGQTSGTQSSGQTGDTQDIGQTGNPQDTGASGDTPAMENLLTVDDENIYDGMDRAYKDGYEPSVANGVASLILPLQADAAIDISSIKVTPDLGATERSPFVFRNYQKTVKRTDEKVNGSEEQRSVFLVKFDFELQPDRYNGVYPVILTVTYTYQGISMSQTFQTYIQINDGQSTEPETEPPVVIEEPDPTSEPKVIITKCTGMPEKIESGDTFSFTAELKNTNKLKSVQNMTVTVACAADGLSIQADSNVFYFDTLGAGASLELPLSFKSDEKAADGKYTVTLTMSYDNPDAVSLSSTGNIEINIRQKIDVVLEAGTMATEINAGDSLSLSVQAMNLGRGKIYNARCQVEVPGLTAEKSLFLGNMDGGSAASGQLDLFAGMVNPEATEDSGRYGKTTGSITLIYEDEAGNEYTVSEDISVTINPLKINSTLNTEDDADDGIGSQLIVGILILLGVILAGTAIPLLIRKKRKKALYEED